MSEADFQPLLEWLKLNPNWLLASVFLISLIESLALAGIIVPGVLLLFLVATVAGHLDFSVNLILFSGFLGAVAGDGISFYLGRFFKDSIPNWWPFSRYPDTLKMGEQFFYKHGGKSIMLGRFIGPIRPILPLTAGMFGMPQLRFAAFNSFSALIWAPFYLLPGYLTGKAVNLKLPDDLLSISLIFLGTLSLIAISFRYLSMRLQIDSSLYDAVLLKKNSGFLFNRLQKHYQSFRLKHPGFEFPLASISLFLINIFLLGIWTYLTLSTNVLVDINQRCLETAIALRSELGLVSNSISKIATHLTLLGDVAFMYVSFGVLVIAMLTRKHYYAALHIVIAGLFTALITYSLKEYFSIARPDILLSPPSSFAYPSGHSSGATVFFALLASFIAQEMEQLKRWQAYCLFSIPIILIAFSRVLLGVHWLTDVIAGISLGLIITSLTRIIYSYFYIKDCRADGSTNIQRRYILLGGILAWTICATIYQLLFFNDALIKMKIID